MAKIILNVDLNSAPAKEQLKSLQNAIQSIATTLSNVKADKNLTAQINALTKNYTALANATQKVTKVNNQNAIAEEKLEQAREKTRKAVADANTAEEKLEQAREKTRKATTDANTAEERTKQARIKSQQAIEKHTQSTEKNTKSVEKNNNSFIKGRLEMTAYLASVQILQSAFTSLNQTLVETEDDTIALQRVLPEGSATNKQIIDDLYEMSQSYGQAFDGVQQATQNFAKAGLDYEDSLKATEAALVAVNVAELDVTQATEGMIAIMTQFGYTANDLMDIVDMLNKVGDQYAVSSDKLLTALQRTGSTAANANLSLEETIGLVTALSEATGRSGENIGTAVNSLIQYTRKASSLDVFAQLSDSAAQAVEDFRLGGADILDIWREVATSINSMSAEQENLLNEWLATDEMQSLTQELHDELGDIFETEEQVYGTANTYRQNYFIALLKNMDTVMEATQTAQNAQGYSQAENEKYMQTYTAQVTALTAQWQHLVSEEQGFLDFKKDLVEFASGILQVIENTGGLAQLLKEVSIIGVTVFGVKNINNIKTFVDNIRLATKAQELATKATQAQAAAEKYQEIYSNYMTKANINAATAQKLKTQATKAATTATKAQTAADQAATAAANAKNLAINLGIGILIAAYSAYKTYKANQKQALLDNADASKEAAEQTQQEVDSLMELKQELIETGEETEELNNKFEEHIKELGFTSDEVKELTNNYNTLGEAIDASIKKKNKEYLLDKQKERVNYEKIIKDIIPSFSIAEQTNRVRTPIGSNSYRTDFLSDLEYYAYNIGDEKLLSDMEELSKLNRTAMNERSIDNIEKYYEKMDDILNYMLEKDLENSDAYDILYNELNRYSDYMQKYFEAKKEEDKANLLSIIDEKLIRNPIDSKEEYDKWVKDALKRIEKGEYGEDTEGLTEAFNNYVSLLLPQYQKETENTISEQEKLKQSLEESAEALNTISKSFSTAKNALSEFNKNGSLSGSTLLEIRNQYKDVVPNIDEYISALSKEGITADEVEQKMADLAVEQAKSAIKTGDLSDENEGLIAELLKENGVLNANEVAHNLIIRAKLEEKAASVDLADTTGESYNAFINEGLAAEYTKEQLAALVAQMQIFNNTDLSTFQKVQKLNEIGDAALRASTRLQYQEFIDNYFLEHAGELTTLTEANEAWLRYAEEHLSELFGTKKDLPTKIDDENNNGNETDTYLENLKNIVELRQSELSLLEKQDRPISEQIAKQYEIKAALQDELNYLISIGADQVEINNLRGQLLDIDTAIVDLRKQEYENRRSYLENELSLMEAQDKNYQEQTAKIREIQEVLHLYADYLRSIGASQEDINDLSIDWLDYMEQIQQLQIDNYESERSLLESEIAIRKNQASIDEIISMYQKVQDLLHQQAEYLRLIGAEQEEINNLSSEWYNIQQDIESLKDDALQNALEAATKPIEEEINLREEAKRKEEEQLDIEEKKKAVLEAQKKLLDTMAQRNVRVYNTATGQWEWQSNAQDIQDAKEELENAQKEYDDAIYDEQTNLLQEQVDWAEKIYEKIQDGDATNEEIIELMKFFSNQWSDSDEEGKKFLHDANIVLGSIIGATYDDATGTWTNSSGHAIFNEIGSAIKANKNEDGTWLPIDFTKVRDTIGNFDVEKLMRQYEIEKNHLVNPMQYIQSFNNGRTYNTNSGNTTSYSLNGVTIPQNASKELAEVLTKIFDDMKLYGN